MRTCRPIAAGVALAATAAALAGCGGSATGTGGAQQTLSVSLTDAGCSPASLKAKAGSIGFKVTNGGTGKVSELELKNEHGIILGERENIVSGIKGSFTLNLKTGRYVLSCPNGDEEDNGTLVVTGTTAAPASTIDTKLVTQAVSGYRSYVESQAAALENSTRQFAAALRAGDVAKAKALFAPTRYHYEAIEPVAESFGNLDPELDARVNDVAKGDRWTGFHRIEQILWIKNTTAGTGPYTSRLLANVRELRQRVKTLAVQPAQLANGAVELLNEVASSKITGEEDRYSHTDLSDFAGNLEGARRAFVLLRPALISVGSRQLATTITQRFDVVSRSLAKYKRPDGTYAPYGALTAADRRSLARQVDALAEPLSTVAVHVAG
jgi:iron uptake system component EfeO